MARISPGTMTAAIVAILMGLGGAYIVRQSLNKPAVPPPPAAAKSANVIYVPIAAADMAPGHTVTMEDILIIKMSPEGFNKSKYSKNQFIRDTNQIASRLLKTPVKKGDAFAPTIFYGLGYGPSIAEQLKPGFRAVTVPIQDIGAVQGFARPGALVDVLFRSEKTEERPAMTLTLLELVEVLAVGDMALPGRTGGEGSVTVAVTPPQAKILKAVEGQGDLTLTLRNPQDVNEFFPINHTNAKTVSGEVRGGVSGGSSSSQRVTLDDLLGFPNQKKVQMEIYMGGNKQVVEFKTQKSNSELEDGFPGIINTPIASQPIRPQPLKANVQQVNQEVETAGGG